MKIYILIFLLNLCIIIQQLQIQDLRKYLKTLCKNDDLIKKKKKKKCINNLLESLRR